MYKSKSQNRCLNLCVCFKPNPKHKKISTSLHLGNRILSPFDPRIQSHKFEFFFCDLFGSREEEKRLERVCWVGKSNRGLSEEKSNGGCTFQSRVLKLRVKKNTSTNITNSILFIIDYKTPHAPQPSTNVSNLNAKPRQTKSTWRAEKMQVFAKH